MENALENPGGSERSAGQGSISCDLLKVIAMATMVADHIGVVLFPSVTVLRLIGRIAFPLYVWLMVIGFSHTSNLRKYLFRLGLFALISEVPFDLAVSGEMTGQWQNIYFTLFISLAMLAVLRNALDKGGRYGVAKAVFTVVAAMLVSEGLHFDYGSAGPVLAAMFYLFWRDGRPGLAAGFLIFSFSDMLDPLLNAGDLRSAAVWSSALASSVTESCGLPAVLLIQRCNGRRKQNRGKLVFYAFYPLHLLILYGIHSLL